MSSYTMKFKDYITEMGGEIVTDDSGTYLNGAQLVGLGGYPIFDPKFRSVLNGMIVDRYMNREIGSESLSDFRRMLRSRMNEIMPFYNQMYRADNLEFNPLFSLDIQTDVFGKTISVMSGESDTESSGNEKGRIDQTGSGNSETETSSDSKSRGVTSDTPQVQLSGSEDYASALADQTSKSGVTGKASEASTRTESSDNENTATAKTNSKSDGEVSSDSKTHTYGFQGSGAENVIRFRESLNNTTMQLLDDLNECFMQIMSFDSDERSHFNSHNYIHSHYGVY